MYLSTHGSRSLPSLLGMLLAATALGCGSAPSEDASSGQSAVSTGNGAPSGAHYDLNLIGVDGTKSGSGYSGNTIFVPLNGSCNVDLTQGSFDVLDGNCTDGTADFQLPNPDPTNSGYTTYSVYVRALGKPGGSSSTDTCATDPTTGDTYCSIYQSVQTRTKGQQTFSNVSKELLYVYYYDSTGRLVRVPLFDPSLENYYWSYDNSGLRNLQMRFYEVSTNVN